MQSSDDWSGKKDQEKRDVSGLERASRCTQLMLLTPTSLFLIDTIICIAISIYKIFRTLHEKWPFQESTRQFD